MTRTNRRKFIGTATAAISSMALSTVSFSKPFSVASTDRFDPWIEVIPSSILSNVKVLHNLSGKKPILAVIKNNGYGLGTDVVAKILEEAPEVVGLAVVKTQAALELRDQGVRKNVLHMGLATPEDFLEMASRNIQVSSYTLEMPKLLESMSSKLNKPIQTHLYIDTGMSRMGIPYHKALPWIGAMSTNKGIQVNGSFMGFTEDPDFDREQLNRLKNLNSQAKAAGGSMGMLHAASSNAIYHFPEAALEMVRPGIALFGAYPSFPEKEKLIAPLLVGYRLCARIVRVEQLRTGDSVSYGRNYIATKPTWIATLPIGHSDGYIRNGVKGAKVFVNGIVYPVIGAVSASHTIIELGDNPLVKIGDTGILFGPDHPEIHPSHVSTVTGVSVYDILMHMNAKLPKVLVDK